MKFLIKLCLLSLVICSVSNAKSVVQNYKEGIHFDVIDSPESSEPEIREFFSFYCQHCYHYEKLTKALKPNLPDGVFYRSHVSNLGMATHTDQVRLTKALVILQSIGGEIKEGGVFSFFDIIHRQMQREVLNTDQSIKEILITVGIDREELEESWNSEKTKAAVLVMVNQQDDLFDREILEGVPSVVVNGKYRVNHKGLNSKDTINDYTGLLNYLLSI